MRQSSEHDAWNRQKETECYINGEGNNASHEPLGNCQEGHRRKWAEDVLQVSTRVSFIVSYIVFH